MPKMIRSTNTTGAKRGFRKGVSAAAIGLFGCLFMAAPHSLAASNNAPSVHAMFVGVADYKHGELKEKGKPAPALQDLQGAPADIAAIRSALESRLELANSLTLMDAQATRNAIIDTFNRLALEAAPGDILVFYFSGHGGRIPDTANQQLSGFSSTIVPYDARDPALAANKAGDIFDNELRLLIDAASARGVNVLTIFDSCHSGTATRDPVFGEDGIRKRGAPDLLIDGPVEPNVEVVPAVAMRSADPIQPGYRVHIAAAPDEELAIERRVKGVWRGDFTNALVAALEEIPASATYRDLMGSVQTNMREWMQSSNARQVMLDVRGEGALDQRFLGGWNPARLLEGTRGDDGVWRLEAGDLGGVTTGSAFAGYRTGGDALNEDGEPLATAFVDATYPEYATLAFAAEIDPATLPDSLVWRETSRGAGDQPLRVAIHPADQASPATLDTLAGLDFVERVEESPHLILYVDQPDTVRIAWVEEKATAKTVAEGDALALQDALGKISRYRNVLRLVGTGAKLDVSFDISETNCMGLEPFPEITRVDGEPQFPSNTEDLQYWINISNNSDKQLYPYLLNLDANFAINFLTGDPAPNATTEVMLPYQCWNWPAGAFGNGRDHLILIMSERPLPGLRNLGQTGLRSAPVVKRGDPLEQLLENAVAGTRSAPGPVPAGAWSVHAQNYMIKGAEE